MSRHCTSGRPASIITENCRVKTARFFGLTDFARSFFGGAIALAATAATLVTMICSRRSALVTDSTVSPMRSPLMVSPPRVRPENAKVGMFLVSWGSLRAWGDYRAGPGRAPGVVRPMPAPATTPTPRLIISVSSSLSDEAFIAVSVEMSRR